MPGRPDDAFNSVVTLNPGLIRCQGRRPYLGLTGQGPGFGYSLLRMAIWQSSGSFRSAALAAIRTPVQASAKPYTAAHGTSTGIRATDGSEFVRAAATITGLAATATQARVPRTPPSP